MDHNELARKIKVKERNRRGTRIQYTLIQRLTIFFLVLLLLFFISMGSLLGYRVDITVRYKVMHIFNGYDYRSRGSTRSGGEARCGRTTHR